MDKADGGEGSRDEHWQALVTEHIVHFHGACARLLNRELPQHDQIFWGHRYNLLAHKRRMRYPCWTELCQTTESTTPTTLDLSSGLWIWRNKSIGQYVLLTRDNNKPPVRSPLDSLSERTGGRGHGGCASLPFSGASFTAAAIFVDKPNREKADKQEWLFNGSNACVRV